MKLRPSTDRTKVEIAESGDALSESVSGAVKRFDDAATIFEQVALGEDFPTFLTLVAYADYLTDED